MKNIGQFELRALGKVSRQINLTATQSGTGASTLFLGYCLFDIP
jgi:hypothetical protein